MNQQVIRILELAENDAVIDIEQRYKTYGPERAPVQVDQDDLNYCINKDWVVYDQEESMDGTVTLIALTPEGESKLYELRQPLVEPPEPTVTTPSVDDSTWPTQAKVTSGLGLYIKGSNTGQMQVSRLCNDGTLRTNGKTGRACRVDPASILEYCQREGVAWNDT